MSTLYYAVNDDKKQAIILGHNNWVDGVEPLKTESEILEFITTQYNRPNYWYKYAESEFAPLAHALAEMGIQRIIMEDYDDYFEVLKYTVIASIYTNKYNVGRWVNPYAR